MSIICFLRFAVSLSLSLTALGWTGCDSFECVYHFIPNDLKRFCFFCLGGDYANTRCISNALLYYHKIGVVLWFSWTKTKSKIYIFNGSFAKPENISRIFPLIYSFRLNYNFDFGYTTHSSKRQMYHFVSLSEKRRQQQQQTGKQMQMKSKGKCIDDSGVEEEWVRACAYTNSPFINECLRLFLFLSTANAIQLRLSSLMKRFFLWLL